MPVILGKAADPLPVESDCGMMTRSLRHAPRSETTEVPSVQVAGTQDPLRRTLPVESEQLKQLCEPAALQLAHELSQFLQDPLAVSKNSVLLHVGKHRPFESTGRSEGHVEHWLKDSPEQVAQSGWHATQAPEDEKALDGHDVTHEPLEASWLFVQVRQNVALPAHVPQVELHALQVKLSLGSRNVPLGQLSIH